MSSTAVMVMVRVAALLVPPSPSVITNRAVRVLVEGASEALR